MAEIRYKIPILSVRALTAYAKEQSDEVYSYNLTKNETESVIQRGSETYQNENAIFYQAIKSLRVDFNIGSFSFGVSLCPKNVQVIMLPPKNSVLNSSILATL